MLLLIAIAIVGIVIWINIAKKSKDGAEVQIGKKMIHGVLFPLIAFLASSLLVGMFAVSRGPDFGILVVPISFFVLFSIPAIMTINSLVMIPKWQTPKTIWIAGSIFPACLFIAGIFLLVHYCK